MNSEMKESKLDIDITAPERDWLARHALRILSEATARLQDQPDDDLFVNSYKQIAVMVHLLADIGWEIETPAIHGTWKIIALPIAQVRVWVGQFVAHDRDLNHAGEELASRLVAGAEGIAR